MSAEPDSGQPVPPARFRGLVVAVVLVVVVILTALIAGRTKQQGGVARPRVSFGIHVSDRGATRGLAYTNGWRATSGDRSITVYAGSERSRSGTGLFVIVRRTAGGSRRIARVTVQQGGAVTLLRPATPATESAAFGATLRFVTASGATGTLDLGSDRVSLSG